MSAQAAPASILRIPPHSIEAEQMCLGAVLLSPETFGRVAEILDVEDFHRSAHARVFEAMKALHAEGQPCDSVLVMREMERRKTVEEVGGREYLTSIASMVQDGSNATHYAGVVREKSIARGLIQASMEIQRAAYDEEGRGEELLERAETMIAEMSRAAARRRPCQSLKEAMAEAFAEMDATTDDRSAWTGYTSLDEILGPLEAGSMTILAGRTSMGKTAFALNVARNALAFGIPVLLFSLEMPRTQIARRLLSMESEVPLNRFRRGVLFSEDEWARIKAAQEQMQAWPLRIDDTAAISVEKMRASVAREQQRHGLGLVIVDYLHLMRPSSGKTIRNRENEVGDLSRGVKAAAMEAQAPFLVLAQLSREAAKDSRKAGKPEDTRPPTLTDLRDSGSLEQDADAVLFVHRPAYYTKRAQDAGIAELIVAKNRNGAIGQASLTWAGASQRFETPKMGGV